MTSPAYYYTTMGSATGDFLGLGTPSLITVTTGTYSGYGGNALFLYSGANFTTITTMTGPSVTSKSMGVLDADFDTKVDWAISTKPSSIEIYRASTRTSVVTLDTSVGTPSVSAPVTGRIASGDVDNDGRPDILVTTSSWLLEGMGYIYSSSYNQAMSGDGGSKGFVFYLNASN